MLVTTSRQKGYCFDRAMLSQESTNSETYDSDVCRTGDNFSLLKENHMILSRRNWAYFGMFAYQQWRL